MEMTQGSASDVLALGKASLLYADSCVLQRLMLELMKKLDSELKHEVCHWAAFYVSPTP